MRMGDCIVVSLSLFHSARLLVGVTLVGDTTSGAPETGNSIALCHHLHLFLPHTPRAKELGLGDIPSRAIRTMETSPRKETNVH